MSRREVDHLDLPNYLPGEGLWHVLRFASNTGHWVDPDGLTPFVGKWVGATYWALDSPVVAVCRAVLRGDHRGLIIMAPQSERYPNNRVKCRTCARLIGRDH